MKLLLGRRSSRAKPYPQTSACCSMDLGELQPPLWLVSYALIGKKIKTENNTHIWSLLNVHVIAANATMCAKIKCATEIRCRGPPLHYLQTDPQLCWKEGSFIQSYGNMRTKPRKWSPVRGLSCISGSGTEVGKTIWAPGCDVRGVSGSRASRVFLLLLRALELDAWI